MSTSAPIRIVIHGRVQGVGFRAFVAEEAVRRDVLGWVRNRRDGTLEAMFAGAPEMVAAMIEACGRGPFGSRVENVATLNASNEDVALRPATERFAVLPTV